MRLMLVTDAWFPQVNGVVRTFSTLVDVLRDRGHEVLVVSPEGFRTIPCPTYPEIRLAVAPGRKIARLLLEFAPDAVHIATEGPLGFSCRKQCLRQKMAFTTSFATRFPEYLEARTRIPAEWIYHLYRWFHRPSGGIMAATPSLVRELAERGFSRPRLWARGVDIALFHPRDKGFLPFPRPILLYVGRVAVEKNITAFLKLDAPGTKVVVGDGPQRAELEREYPEARFLGAKFGEDLAGYYAAADVFVFPSLTDTFGLVMLEALACGVPVAAFPVTGPLDVVGGSDAAVLDNDLGEAVRRALELDPDACRRFAEGFSWDRVADLFLSHIVPAKQDAILAFKDGGASKKRLRGVQNRGTARRSTFAQDDGEKKLL